MKIKDVNIEWLGHAGFLISNKGKSIYIDPYNIKESEKKADMILITHSHYDHCSIADISKIIKSGTTIVLPADVQSKITKFDQKISMQVVEPGDMLDLGAVKIDVVAAYNINKEFHPKQENWLGFVIKLGSVVVYHAGDTDLIPEMQKLTGYGGHGNELVVLLPVGGKYTMNTEEAAKAAAIIKPTLAIPMHYATIIGTEEDAQKFCQLCQEKGIKCQVLEKV